MKIPKRIVSDDRLIRLAEDICVNFGTHRVTKAMLNYEQKTQGFDSEHLQTHWEYFVRKGQVPKQWTNWVSSGYLRNDPDVHPEVAVSYVIGDIRRMVDALDSWTSLQTEMKTLSVLVPDLLSLQIVDVENVDAFITSVISKRVKKIRPPSWLSMAEKVISGIRETESITEQFEWPDETSKDVCSMIIRWELARRDHQTSSPCPLWHYASVLDLGLIPSHSDLWIPVGAHRAC